MWYLGIAFLLFCQEITLFVNITILSSVVFNLYEVRFECNAVVSSLGNFTLLLKCFSQNTQVYNSGKLHQLCQFSFSLLLLVTIALKLLCSSWEEVFNRKRKIPID